jgi:hypothetical protein
MAWHPRWAPLATLAVLALASAACAVPIRVNAYAERGADLSRYRTYDFAPIEPVATGDPRLDSNPFFNERVRGAVDKGLGAKGYQRVTLGAPDFLVHFHASVAQDINVVELDQQRGYCAQDNCKPFVYDAGTLLVDLVDARTKALVWRGWAESTFDGVVDNQAWMEERIDASVARVLAKMPHRTGSAGGG